jgi:hypothetical protein
MEAHPLKNVNNYWNTNIYSHLETYGIVHLWQLKTVVFLYWCLICTVLLSKVYLSSSGTSGENSCCTSSNKE